MPATFLRRLDARDRELLVRWSDATARSRSVRRFWTALTHLGGATVSIFVALLPLLHAGWFPEVGRRALAILVASHLIVQLVKRTVGRPRPSRGTHCVTLVAEPDKFSFPSGHSAAAMSIAFAFAVAYPAFALPLYGAALLVGLSRVFLGVHYPGDVFVGQLIAVLTGLLFRAF